MDMGPRKDGQEHKVEVGENIEVYENVLLKVLRVQVIGH